MNNNHFHLIKDNSVQTPTNKQKLLNSQATKITKSNYAKLLLCGVNGTMDTMDLKVG